MADETGRPQFFVGPITGYAVGGERMKRGAEIEVKDINAKGGVLGKRLDLIIADDACDPEQAIAAAKNIVVFSPPRPARAPAHRPRRSPSARSATR